MLKWLHQMNASSTLTLGINIDTKTESLHVNGNGGRTAIDFAALYHTRLPNKCEELK